MKEDIIINAPNQGIAQSPHGGFGDVRNLDIFTIPGVVRLNNLLAKKSSTTVTAQIKWFRRDPNDANDCYAIDSNGVVYNSTDAGATWASLSDRTGSGQGLEIWKDYLFVGKETTLDVYGPLAGATFTVTIASPAVFSKTGHGLVANDTIVFSTTGALPTGLTAGTTYHVIASGLTADAFEVSTSQGGSAVNTSGSQSGVHTYRAWKLDWKTIDSDTDWHPMKVSDNDGKLYGGAGRYVFSLDEVSGQTYLPGTSGTYTFTQQALDLPSNYKIKCIEELGNNLMLGTWRGSNVYDFKIATIFPWDRSSVSFGQPILLNENGVHAMLNIGGLLHVLAGIEGKIYISDGVGAQVAAQIPSSISNLEDGNYLEPYPGAVAFYKGRFFFGMATGGTKLIDGMGVWSMMRTGKGNILNLEHVISTGNYGASTVVKISALLPISRDEILVGWRDDTTYGIDKTTNTSRVTSYGGYFDSPLYQVGTQFSKRSLTELEIVLVKELAANEGVRVKYRVNLTDSFSSVIATFDYATYGVVISHNPLNIPSISAEFIQFRVEVTGTTTTPQLRQLRIR